MIKEKSCGALVYRVKNHKVDLLVLKHRLGGHWAFPKGHVEADESERETALREVKEETGLNIIIQPSFKKRVFYSPKKDVEKQVVYFLGYAPDDRTVMQEEEIKAIKWVPIMDAHKYLTFRNDRRLLNSVRRYLRNTGLLPYNEPKPPTPVDNETD